MDLSSDLTKQRHDCSSMVAATNLIPNRFFTSTVLVQDKVCFQRSEKNFNFLMQHHYEPPIRHSMRCLWLQEKDERVAKALREAIEVAEKRAKEEKARARRKHLPAECRTPQPELPTEPQKCGQPQVGGCGSASQKTTLGLESNQGNVEVIESRTVVPCQKKSEILVYHTEVVLKSPPPHKTPQVQFFFFFVKFLE